MVPYAISSATAVRVGHALGRIRTGHAPSQAASAAGWSGILAGAAFMLFAAIVFLTLPGTLARIFTPDRGVDRRRRTSASRRRRLPVLRRHSDHHPGALRGAGNTLAPFFTHLVCYWIIGMPLGILLGFHAHLGAAGLWLGLLIALTGAALVLLTVWRRTTNVSVSKKLNHRPTPHQQTKAHLMAQTSPFVFKTLQQKSTPKPNVVKTLRKNTQGGVPTYCDDDPVARWSALRPPRSHPYPSPSGSPGTAQWLVPPPLLF